MSVEPAALPELRARLDAIDVRLADLFAERMGIVGQVAERKAAENLPLYDSARERQIQAAAAARVGEDLERYSRRVFGALLDVSRAYQRSLLGLNTPLTERIRAAVAAEAPLPTKATVACQGTEGAYAQQACDQLFPFASILYFNDFESVFQAVEKGLCRYGVLPIENSLAGSVTQVYDLMAKHAFTIAAATKLRIDHVLLAPKGAKLSGVRQVFSHPQALAQCAGFFRAHPALERVPCENTAVAARRVTQAGDPAQAAIASRICADLYNLDILADSVADDTGNHTRFLCIGRDLEVHPDPNRVSLILSLPHKPGALSGLMSRLAAQEINLTKLESRPVPGADFQFRFHLDMEADIRTSAVISLLGELEQSAERFQFLGGYREV